MIEQIASLGLIDEADLELDTAALEIAALDHPEVELAGYLELLERITERLAVRAAAARTPREQAAELADVLAAEFGFEGDRKTYDDPANADLIRVIDRRRGLPVALAILYVAAARRLGWAAHVLNTPGHVLAAIGQPALVIDPFNRGGVVGGAQLAALLQTTEDSLDAVAPDHLAPMSNRAVLVRLLMNQATRAERAGELPRALAVLQRITTVAPAYSAGWWERARLERALGDAVAARESLAAMLETTRDPGLRSHVTSALDALTD
ncbi:transglutaminase-like domain-containing protein [Phenylobacterium sp. LjRoot225]|uniref:SirB1 family protein n=1 Tax=Phenylobacterium sp. LjRoot225 TaxID=3342285 RepID=UPI003ECDEC25